MCDHLTKKLLKTRTLQKCASKNLTCVGTRGYLKAHETKVCSFHVTLLLRALARIPAPSLAFFLQAILSHSPPYLPCHFALQGQLRLPNLPITSAGPAARRVDDYATTLLYQFVCSTERGRKRDFVKVLFPSIQLIHKRQIAVSEKYCIDKINNVDALFPDGYAIPHLMPGEHCVCGHEYVDNVELGNCESTKMIIHHSK